MNGYTQLVKQWKKEYDQKVKLERQETTKRQELDEKIKTASICANMLEQIKQREKQEQLTQIKSNIILALRQNNPFTYKQYLIVWDILNTDYSQILSDYNRGKVNKQEIINAIEYVSNFSMELISDYWRESLLSA